MYRVGLLYLGLSGADGLAVGSKSSNEIRSGEETVLVLDNRASLYTLYSLQSYILYIHNSPNSTNERSPFQYGEQTVPFW